MITLQAKGDFKKTTSFFEKLLENVHLGQLDKYGRLGVSALSSATPVDSGKTADSWYYEIEHNQGSTTISFHNSNTDTYGTPIAILLQYGHATKNGGFVQGRDFINPAVKPVFDELAEAAWKEVTK